MNYQVHITKTAEHDIAKAADYIEFVLKNPQAADHLLDVATEKIGELTQMPEKLQLVDDPVLAVWGIRFIRVNNYLAFYTIDEDKKVVIIVRFLYQKATGTPFSTRIFTHLRNLLLQVLFWQSAGLPTGCLEGVWQI